MKYELKKICKDKDNHVAYIKLLDDFGNVFDEICVEYNEDEKIFKEDINKKANKKLEKYNSKVNIKTRIEDILNNM